tara:strand:- start:212 stop:436 length:225 start_codon:yes stop_codon:yes gene_type:complete
VREQFKLFILEDVVGALNVDFSVFIGWVYIVNHILDRSVNNKLISQPWIKLGDKLVDSLKFGDFPDNFGLECPF